MMANSTVNNTTDKEKAGENAIKLHQIFDKAFPNNLGYKKVTGKKLQMAGVDYIVFGPDNTEIYIDLKVGIGPDYSMKSQDYKTDDVVLRTRVPAIAVELYQYGQFTNTKNKMTDFMLYYINDPYNESFYLISYVDICNISKKHKKQVVVENGVAKEVFTGTQKVYKSFNGTGDYIKIPAEKYSTFTYKIR